MNKVINNILLLMVISFSGVCQETKYVFHGEIEFEKTINMHALIRRSITKSNETVLKPAFEDYKKNQPQFRKLKSTLKFSNEKSLYTPTIGYENGNGGFFSNYPEIHENNVVFTDFSTSKSISQRKVFDEYFQITDSLKKIKWKITSETREIAGINCRRANGLFLDSVYIVAFYTDKIPLNSGPESFSGLPGMILGVVLPYENMTWFAINVKEMGQNDIMISPPKKGKILSFKLFSEFLKDAVKSWGEYANSVYKFLMI